MIGLYYLLYLPKIIESQLDYNPSIKFYVAKQLSILFYSTCVCNPVVYVWQDKNFRGAFKKLLHIKSETMVQNLTNSTSVWNTWHNSYRLDTKCTLSAHCTSPGLRAGILQGVKLLAFRDIQKHCWKAIFFIRISDWKAVKTFSTSIPKAWKIFGKRILWGSFPNETLFFS